MIQLQKIFLAHCTFISELTSLYFGDMMYDQFVNWWQVLIKLLWPMRTVWIAGDLEYTGKASID